MSKVTTVYYGWLFQRKNALKKNVSKGGTFCNGQKKKRRNKKKMYICSS
jgi:hypothetical protein